MSPSPVCGNVTAMEVAARATGCECMAAPPLWSSNTRGCDHHQKAATSAVAVVRARAARLARGAPSRGDCADASAAKVSLTVAQRSFTVPSYARFGW
ncbi:hypothetical protein GCM10009815_10790 [Nocardioides marmoribigeumensis]